MAGPRRRLVPMGALSVVLFFFSLSLFTWKNSFPYYYHIDEPLEVLLVLENETNFHHPLLMGNVTDLATRILHVARTPQPLVETGRWCLAVFGAIAVVAFAWLAFHYRGLGAALAAGVLVAVHPLLIEVTHYYKEDPALLMGLALSFLAMAHFWQRPSWQTTLLLGGANALAFSGKYIGIVAAVLALIVIFRVPLGKARLNRLGALALFALAFFVVAGGVNYQLVRGLGTMAGGVGREVVLLDAGGGRGLLTGKYLSVVQEQCNGLILFFTGWLFLQMWRTRRDRTLPEFLLAGFPFAFGLMLSLTPKTAERYFLPAGVTICYLAGLGIADFSTRVAAFWKWEGWKKRLLTVACVAVTCAVSTPEILGTLRGFSSDSRRELARWLEEHAAPDAVIVQDRRVQLVGSSGKENSDRAFTPAQTVLSKKDAADFGSIQELRERGVRYVAIDAGEKSKGGDKQQAAFYRDLKTTGELVWKGGWGPVIVLNPRLELYRLPPLFRED